jgi:NAD(P)-dependent dehydrogenase (short-subunit alcohol dehydrogenase family)
MSKTVLITGSWFLLTTTKWAIEGLSESISYELRPFNIRVKIIEPGGIKTNFIDRGTTWASHSDYEMN